MVLKEQIINCVQNEPNKNVRRKCADLAAEVARNLTDEDGEKANRTKEYQGL